MSNQPSSLSAGAWRHRDRLHDVIEVFVRYGFAQWVSQSATLPRFDVAEQVFARQVDPEIAGLSDGARLRAALVELGTTWIKFGQMLSLRPDLLGPEIAGELELLQATVPADPPGVAQQLVERELGGPVSELYASFEVEPLASGSVAQVHRATLHDGTEVAVKVLHAGTAERVTDDLDLMRTLANHLEQQDPEIAQYRPTVLVAELDRMLSDAIDLGQELHHLQQFAVNFADEPVLVIPTGYPELCTSRVLTMSLLRGEPFSDRATVEATGWDVQVLVERATDIYLKMVFRDGLYHADPHPGNFLIPDGEHLAILDFGDVGRVSAVRRRQLEALVIGIGTRDIDGIVDTVLEITAAPASVDTVALRDDIETWINTYLFIDVGHLDMVPLVNAAMEVLRTYHLVFPADLALLCRVLLRLQGLGQAVDAEIHVADLLQPYIQQMMVKRFDPKRFARRALKTGRSWEHLVATLPDDLRAILQQIRSGQLGVDFRVHDADGAVDRLVDGLVASASVLASAQLLSRRTGPKLFGISAPGAVALGIGFVTWQRLATKRPQHRTLVTRARQVAQSKAPGG